MYHQKRCTWEQQSRALTCTHETQMADGRGLKEAACSNAQPKTSNQTKTHPAGLTLNKSRRFCREKVGLTQQTGCSPSPQTRWSYSLEVESAGTKTSSTLEKDERSTMWHVKQRCWTKPLKSVLWNHLGQRWLIWSRSSANLWFFWKDKLSFIHSITKSAGSMKVWWSEHRSELESLLCSDSRYHNNQNDLELFERLRVGLSCFSTRLGSNTNVLMSNAPGCGCWGPREDTARCYLSLLLLEPLVMWCAVCCSK